MAHVPYRSGTELMIAPWRNSPGTFHNFQVNHKPQMPVTSEREKEQKYTAGAIVITAGFSVSKHLLPEYGHQSLLRDKAFNGIVMYCLCRKIWWFHVKFEICWCISKYCKLFLFLCISLNNNWWHLRTKVYKRKSRARTVWLCIGIFVCSYRVNQESLHFV